MSHTLFAVLSLLVASTSAFMVAPLRPRVAVARVSMAIEDVAASCIEEGCPLDLVEDLIAELKAEDNKEASALVKQLTALIQNPEANRSEIEKFVLAAGRTFSTVEGFKFPGEALGYSTKPSNGNSLD